MPDTVAFGTFGVPTYYINVAVPELAGGGNVRIWNCSRHRGILIPQCEIIIPAADLIVASRTVSDAAHNAFNIEAMGVPRLAN